MKEQCKLFDKLYFNYLKPLQTAFNQHYQCFKNKFEKWLKMFKNYIALYLIQ